MFLNQFKKWTTIAILIAVLIQNIFFPSLANFFGTFIVLVLWVLTYWLIMQPINFKRYTFSTFILLGFSFTQFILPVIFLLTEWKPLIFNLKFPLSVFLHSFLSFLVLLIAFLIYKNRFHFIRDILQKILKNTPVYSPPTNKQLWLMGVLGVIAILLKKIIFKSDVEVSTGSEWVNLIAGFIPFTFLPLLIPLQKVFKKRTESYSMITIILFFVLIVVLGILVNSRGQFMEGLLIVGLVYFLGLLIGKFNYRIFKFKTLLIVGIAGWLLTGPLSDLGTAMVVTRSLRSDISATQLLHETFKTYQNKEALRRYIKIAKLSDSDWDETYFDNIFLARFCNLKFNDASLEQAYKLKNLPDRRMQKVVDDKFWATFPHPIINYFDLKIDKKKINSGSYGDFLYNLNSRGGIGGFRTGNFEGVGLASFGWWYLLVLFVGSFLLFSFADAFVYKLNNGRYLPSILGLMSIGFFFTYFGVSSSSESITTIFIFVIRGWIQLVLLYILVYFITKKISQIR